MSDAAQSSSIGEGAQDGVAPDVQAGLPNVLQVLPSIEIGGGGVERATLDIAEALAAAGTRPVVVSSGGRHVSTLERRGAIHVTLPVASKNPLVIYRNVERLRRLIEEYDIGLVHARSRAPAWSALFAARRAGVPFVTTFHGTYNFGSGTAGLLKKRYNSVMVRGDRVIANSHFTADHIRRHYDVSEERLRIVPRGVDVDVFDPAMVSAPRIIDLARRWQLPDGKTIVMLPGRLTRWKGHTLLIEALAELKAQRTARDPDAPFDVLTLFVGSDQGRNGYRNELEGLIKTRDLEGAVQILGHCDDMSAAYMMADVVVSASTDPEAFGRIVAEAQAMGRPDVVADHGGAAEQVLSGETGWLFAPGNAGSLARALDQALSIEPEQRAAISAAAYAHVRRHYTKRGMCAATLAIYAELARSAAAA
ncbi:MAG: glycosyltransferase family 4 protein [Alphaproteobacteria bacterium]